LDGEGVRTLEPGTQGAQVRVLAFGWWAIQPYHDGRPEPRRGNYLE